jgi:hypothetical protein
MAISCHSALSDINYAGVRAPLSRWPVTRLGFRGAIDTWIFLHRLVASQSLFVFYLAIWIPIFSSTIMRVFINDEMLKNRSRHQYTPGLCIRRRENRSAPEVSLRLGVK